MTRRRSRQSAVWRCCLLALLVLLPAVAGASDEGHEGHHPNHLALAGGAASLDSKTSGYIGADYIRSWANGWGLGGFYEEVSGDFNLQVIGLIVSRDFGHGWRFSFGPGVERKIVKDKTLNLARLQGSYSWHSGRWSYGPVVTADLIEDGNTTYYAGITVGFGWK